ncbi:MAG: hypothetical protein ACPGRE_05090 [Flavobacteriaceae bacterium]
MNIYKPLWSYYLFISCSALCLMGLSQLSLGYFDLKQLIFAGLSTFLVYNFIHWMHSKIKLDFRFLLIVLSGLGLIFTLDAFRPIQLLLLAFSGFLSTLYELGPNVQLKGLRYWRFFKLFHISISWFVLCFLIPGMQSGNQVIASVIYYLIFGLSWCFLWAFAFDIRDVNSDKGTLFTLANYLSTSSQNLLFVLIFVLGGLSLFFSNSFSTVSLAMLIIVFFSCLWAHKIHNSWFYIAFLDGLPILWFCLLYF